MVVEAAGRREELGSARSHGHSGGELEACRFRRSEGKRRCGRCGGLTEATSDGFEERGYFGEVAGFVGEFGEELLGGVGLAEEALVDLLLQAFGEDKAEGEEDCNDAEDSNDVACADGPGCLKKSLREKAIQIARRLAPL